MKKSPSYPSIFLTRKRCKTYLLIYFYLALDEARDINLYLKPLRRHLDDIEQADVPELGDLLAPMMHAIGLLWGNSKFYCKPARIIVLLQEIGNLLIEIVRNIDTHCFEYVS